MLVSPWRRSVILCGMSYAGSSDSTDPVLFYQPHQYPYIPAWSESPAYSRSVSPCDEYQPPHTALHPPVQFTR